LLNKTCQIRVCANCTYGRFDQSFEDLIIDIRNTYPGISTKKDLPLDDEQHQDLKEVELWDEHHPIIFHIHNNPKIYEQGEPSKSI